MIQYFAYGSNMDEEDFEKRCREKGWRTVNFKNCRAAKLDGYKLTFNYYSASHWKAGAANIMESRRGCVYGLLFDIEEDELETIRKKEGYSQDCSNCYYNEVCVDVGLLSDRKVVKSVKTYKVSKCREETDHQPPTREYMNLIIKNAGKYGFPSEYIKYLESFSTKD
jgi:cation transport regulator ChaC